MLRETCPRLNQQLAQLETVPNLLPTQYLIYYYCRSSTLSAGRPDSDSNRSDVIQHARASEVGLGSGGGGRTRAELRHEVRHELRVMSPEPSEPACSLTSDIIGGTSAQAPALVAPEAGQDGGRRRRIVQVALAKAKQSSRSLLPKLSQLSKTVEGAHPDGETAAREGDCEEEEEPLEGEGEPIPQPVTVSAEEGKEEEPRAGAKKEEEEEKEAKAGGKERQAPEKHQPPTLQPPTVPPRRR